MTRTITARQAEEMLGTPLSTLYAHPGWFPTITPKEAEAELGVPCATVRRWARVHQLDHYGIHQNGEKRYRRSAIEQLVRSTRRRNTQPRAVHAGRKISGASGRPMSADAG